MENNWFKIWPSRLRTVGASLSSGVHRAYLMQIAVVYLDEGGLPAATDDLSFKTALPISAIEEMQPYWKHLGRVENERLHIDFLDEILYERQAFAEKRAQAGSNGGASKAKQKLAKASKAKQTEAKPSQYIQTDNTDIEREEASRNLTPFSDNPDPQGAKDAMKLLAEYSGETLGIHQQEQIQGENITDLGAWREVLTMWQTNAYKWRNLSGMFERYRYLTKAKAKGESERPRYKTPAEWNAPAPGKFVY